MTTCAAILALLPLALGVQDGIGDATAVGHRDSLWADGTIAPSIDCPASVVFPPPRASRDRGSLVLTLFILIGGFRQQYRSRQRNNPSFIATIRRPPPHSAKFVNISCRPRCTFAIVVTNNVNTPDTASFLQAKSNFDFHSFCCDVKSSLLHFFCESM